MLALAQKESQQQTQQQRQARVLVQFWHASKCKAAAGQCKELEDCAITKALWAHVSTCADPHCQQYNCYASKYLLSHFQRCKAPTCAVCPTVHAVIKIEQERQQLQREGSPAAGSTAGSTAVQQAAELPDAAARTVGGGGAAAALPRSSAVAKEAERKFECQVCGNLFHTAHGVVMHNRRTSCAQERNGKQQPHMTFACNLCGQACKSELGVAMHQKRWCQHAEAPKMQKAAPKKRKRKLPSAVGVSAMTERQQLAYVIEQTMRDVAPEDSSSDGSSFGFSSDESDLSSDSGLAVPPGPSAKVEQGAPRDSGAADGEDRGLALGHSAKSELRAPCDSDAADVEEFTCPHCDKRFKSAHGVAIHKVRWCPVLHPTVPKKAPKAPQQGSSREPSAKVASPRAPHDRRQSGIALGGTAFSAAEEESQCARLYDPLSRCVLLCASRAVVTSIEWGVQEGLRCSDDPDVELGYVVDVTDKATANHWGCKEFAQDEMPDHTTNKKHVQKILLQWATVVHVCVCRTSRAERLGSRHEKRPQPIVVHCRNSRSRSPAVLVSFFSLFRGLPMERAGSWVSHAFREQRTCVASRSSTEFPSLWKFQGCREGLELEKVRLRQAVDKAGGAAAWLTSLSSGTVEPSFLWDEVCAVLMHCNEQTDDEDEHVSLLEVLSTLCKHENCSREHDPALIASLPPSAIARDFVESSANERSRRRNARLDMRTWEAFTQQPPPIGSRIEIYWEDDKVFYPGAVTGYRGKLEKQRAIIEYDDGTKEKLNLEKEQWRLLDGANGTGPVVAHGQLADCDDSKALHAPPLDGVAGDFELEEEDAPRHDHLVADTDTVATGAASPQAPDPPVASVAAIAVSSPGEGEVVLDETVVEYRVPLKKCKSLAPVAGTFDAEDQSSSVAPVSAKMTRPNTDTSERKVEASNAKLRETMEINVVIPRNMHLGEHASKAFRSAHRGGCTANRQMVIRGSRQKVCRQLVNFIEEMRSQQVWDGKLVLAVPLLVARFLRCYLLDKSQTRNGRVQIYVCLRPIKNMTATQFVFDEEPFGFEVLLHLHSSQGPKALGRAVGMMSDLVSSPDACSVHLLVPMALVGSLLGSRGSLLEDIERKSKAYMHMEVKGNTFPNTSCQLLLISGVPDAIGVAFQAVFDILAKRAGSGRPHVELVVPWHARGRSDEVACLARAAAASVHVEMVAPQPGWGGLCVLQGNREAVREAGTICARQIAGFKRTLSVVAPDSQHTRAGLSRTSRSRSGDRSSAQREGQRDGHTGRSRSRSRDRLHLALRQSHGHSEAEHSGSLPRSSIADGGGETRHPTLGPLSEAQKRDGWREVYCRLPGPEYGKLYYFRLPDGWKEGASNGRPYYWNKLKKESCFERPTCEVTWLRPAEPMT